MICKRCGNEINYTKGWKCSVRPSLTCIGYTGEYRSYKVNKPSTYEDNPMDQLIESYTYARVSGSTKPLDHLDVKAQEIINQQSEKMKNTLDVLFNERDYEDRLRYLQSEKKNK